ncbi:NAD(P)-binding protein [Streptomyces sp. A7024]|uniref:NAD(P)-binding protein n=1 Tax=Streptomyces coryli TaxID=1128680 RepID=A0A6G4TSU3_9ACTN|nr:FAD-dependent oxidoreductase [Streptomyces coryli]NGN63089.1 NAD(P)-binding protein [Streptomyces coryli]
MTADASRRSFLTSVGAAGGAGLLYSAMGALGLAPVPDARAEAFRPPRRSDFTLTGRAGGRRVVILGAGMAGLAAAYELGKAGYDCRILEAKDRPGGRNWTVRSGTTLTDLDGRTQTARFSDGQYMNAGPGRLPQSHVTLEYCRELGVPLEVFTNTNANAYIHHDDGPLGGKPVRWRTAKADVYGYVSELLAKATDRGALDKELTAGDRERLIEFLRDFGDLKGKADGYAYAGSDRRGYSVEPGAGAEAGTVLDGVPSLSDVVASGLGQHFSFEFGYDQAMLMFQPVGGMDAIPRALAKAIGRERISYGARVTEVTDLADGAEVAYTDAAGRSRVARGDFVVAALPPMVLARIKHNLGADITAALKYPAAAPVGKIGLEYRSRWWETDEHIYGGITPTDNDLATIWYPSYGYHGRRGTLIGYYNFGADAVSYGKLPHRERLERALRRGERIHGAKYRAELAESFSVAWHRTPHIEGGWVGWESQTGPEYRLLNRPAGHVHFAGDWLSHVIAWQHGAICSARQAVTAIHERALAA